MKRLKHIGVSLALLSCAAHRPVAEGYRVIKYDAKSGEWTLLRNGTWSGERQLKRITVVCASTNGATVRR